MESNQVNTNTFFWKKRSWINVFFFLCFIALFFLKNFNSSVIYQRPMRSDAVQYMSFAYHMYHHGTFSHKDRSEHAKATAHRSPFHPLYLAACIALSPDSREKDLPALLETPPSLPKVINLIMLLICSLIASYLLWKTTRNFLASLLVFNIIGYCPQMLDYANMYMSEMLICFLLTLLSLSFFLVCKNNKPVYYLASGIFLALLTLTRAIFQFLFPACFLLLLVFALFQKNKRNRYLIKIIVFSLPFVLIVGFWVYRNHKRFNRAYIANRGGKILMVRAESNMMTSDVFFAAFFEWSSSAKIRNLGKKLLPKETRYKLNKYRTSSYHRYVKNLEKETIRNMGGENNPCR